MLFSLFILAGCDRAERRLVGFWPIKRRAVPSAPGVGRTRHPRMGAAEQPSVAVWEPSRNQRLTKFPALQSAGAALSVNLLKIKERRKPRQLKKKFPRRSPHARLLQEKPHVRLSDITGQFSAHSQGVASLRASLRILVRRLDRRSRRRREVPCGSSRRNISSTC